MMDLIMCPCTNSPQGLYLTNIISLQIWCLNSDHSHRSSCVHTPVSYIALVAKKDTLDNIYFHTVPSQQYHCTKMAIFIDTKMVDHREWWPTVPSARTSSWEHQIQWLNSSIYWAPSYFWQWFLRFVVDLTVTFPHKACRGKASERVLRFSTKTALHR